MLTKEEKSKQIINLILNQGYEFLISFGITNSKATLLLHKSFPNKDQIESIKILCEYFLKLSDKDIEMEKILYKEEQLKENKTSVAISTPTKSKSGFIYFIQDDMGRIKIGKTTRSLKKRLRGITLPIQPILIHSFPSNNIDKSENLLHEKYHKYRLNGEWFKLPKKIIETIKELHNG